MLPKQKRVISAPFKGINQVVNPEFLGPSQLTDAINVVNRFGRLAPRPGLDLAVDNQIIISPRFYTLAPKAAGLVLGSGKMFGVLDSGSGQNVFSITVPESPQQSYLMTGGNSPTSPKDIALNTGVVLFGTSAGGGKIQRSPQTFGTPTDAVTGIGESPPTIACNFDTINYSVFYVTGTTSVHRADNVLTSPQAHSAAIITTADPIVGMDYDSNNLKLFVATHASGTVTVRRYNRDGTGHEVMWTVSSQAFVNGLEYSLNEDCFYLMTLPAGGASRQLYRVDGSGTPAQAVASAAVVLDYIDPAVVYRWTVDTTFNFPGRLYFVGPDAVEASDYPVYWMPIGGTESLRIVSAYPIDRTVKGVPAGEFSRDLVLMQVINLGREECDYVVWSPYQGVITTLPPGYFESSDNTSYPHTFVMPNRDENPVIGSSFSNKCGRASFAWTGGMFDGAQGALIADGSGPYCYNRMLGDTIQEIAMIDGTATTGTFRLRYPPTGEISKDIQFDATAAEVRDILEDMDAFDCVHCTGGPIDSDPILVRFAGSLSGRDVELLEVMPFSEPLVIQATQDTFLDEEAPTTNAGNSGDAHLRSWTGNKNRRTLFEFPLTGLPDGAVLTAASFARKCTGNTGTAAAKCYRSKYDDIYLPRWKEGNGGVSVGADWNTRNGTTNWTGSAAHGTSGTDFFATGETAYTSPTSGSTLTLDMLAAVNASLSANANYITFFDQFDTESAGSEVSCTFGTRNITDRNERPTLTLTYAGALDNDASITVTSHQQGGTDTDAIDYLYRCGLPRPTAPEITVVGSGLPDGLYSYVLTYWSPTLQLESPVGTESLRVQADGRVIRLEIDIPDTIYFSELWPLISHVRIYKRRWGTSSSFEPDGVNAYPSWQYLDEIRITTADAGDTIEYEDNFSDADIGGEFAPFENEYPPDDAKYVAVMNDLAIWNSGDGYLWISELPKQGGLNGGQLGFQYVSNEAFSLFTIPRPGDLSVTGLIPFNNVLLVGTPTMMVEVIPQARTASIQTSKRDLEDTAGLASHWCATSARGSLSTARGPLFFVSPNGWVHAYSGGTSVLINRQLKPIIDTLIRKYWQDPEVWPEVLDSWHYCTAEYDEERNLLFFSVLVDDENNTTLHLVLSLDSGPDFDCWYKWTTAGRLPFVMREFDEDHPPLGERRLFIASDGLNVFRFLDGKGDNGSTFPWSFRTASWVHTDGIDAGKAFDLKIKFAERSFGGAAASITATPYHNNVAETGKVLSIDSGSGIALWSQFQQKQGQKLSVAFSGTQADNQTHQELISIRPSVEPETDRQSTR